jgi:hypothetical protein
MKLFFLLLGFLAGMLQAQAQSFVSSIAPSRNALNIRSSTAISLSFITDINPATLTTSTVKVCGSLSGPHILKSILYSSVTRTVEIVPAVEFSGGETVTIVVTTGVQSAIGDVMPAPFESQWTTAARGGSGVLTMTSFPGTGNQPWAAATADFDHNGVLDFLVLNRTTQSVSMLRNFGGGNFLQISTSPVGSTPSSFVVADLNGDDIPDCAVANEGSNTVTVLFMDARGSTTRSVSFPALGGPSAIVAADVDGDGHMDLIVAGRTSNLVSVYKNDGTGTFTLFSATPVNAGPSALVCADFNNDNLMDIAVANETANTVTILINNGTGKFSASTPIPVAADPVSLAAGDFDNDGAMDLVVAGKASSKISVLRNDGTGILYAANVFTSVASPSTVATGDMDGDGNCDIVGLGGSITVFHNQGYFQFAPLPSVVAGAAPHGLVLADIDGDGDLDCAAPNSVSSSLVLFANRPPVSASLTPASLDFSLTRPGVLKQMSLSIRNDGVTIPLNVMSITSSNDAVFSCSPPNGLIAPQDSATVIVTFAPTDARNFTDSLTFITNDPMKPMVKVLLKGVGGLVVLSTLPSGGGTVSDGSSPVTIAFNGVIDAASLRSSTLKLFGEMTGLHAAQFSINAPDRKAAATPVKKFLTGEHVSAVLTDSLGTASGSIRLLDGYAVTYSVSPTRGSQYHSASGSFTTGAGPYAVAAGDFNGDGYADIAVVNSRDNTVSVLMNDTHGGLASQAVYNVGAFPQALVVADVNEDGAPDIIVANTSGNSLSILLNKNLGDGTFFPATVAIPTGNAPQAVAVGDLNNDGHLDIVTANTIDNTISLYTNDGAAHYTLWKIIQVGSSPRAIVVADFNNDGASDIAVLNGGSGSITLLTNSHGTFTASTFAAGSAPVAMTANDFNHDGFMDLVIANGGPNSLSIVLNNCSGGFTPASTVSLYNKPTALYSGDMNGDGAADLAVAQYASASVINTLQVFTNTGSGAFVRGDSVVTGSPTAVTGFDLNNQGILHLAVTNLLTSKITVINPAPGQTPVLLSPLPSTASMKQPIYLLWQNDGQAIFYHVQVADSVTGVLLVNDSTLQQRQYVLTGLAYATTYKWRVRTKNEFGWGDCSQWWNLTTCIAPPLPPTLLAPAPAATDETLDALVAWQASPSASSYRIQASEDSLFRLNVIDTTSSNTAWRLHALKVHVTYFWRVKATNTGGESDWSENRSFTTLLPMPEQVHLSAPVNNAHLGSMTINFSWRTTQWEVNRYWFEIAADSLFMFRIVDSSVVDTTWQMQKFSGNQKYFWKVRAQNAKGWGPFSDLAVFSIGPTSVSDNGKVPDHFGLEQNFPNPFNPSTQLQFSIATACDVRLTIFDILGREIAELVHERLASGTYTVHWNAHDLPSGIYLYRLTAGTFVSTKKLSLQK